jgi:hypothetical protein
MPGIRKVVSRMSGTPPNAPERIHYLLTGHVIERGHAPDVETLARLAGCTEREAAEGLARLRDQRGVILEPDSTRVWSLHPFALTPTSFWVVTDDRRGWWANCAWCSLGVAAALNRAVTVSARDGGEGDPLTVRVEAGRPSREDLVVHFPYPPARWWDNPYAPCANILFFTSAETVDGWCARHGRPRGAVVRVDTVAELAGLWFGDYASPDWRRKTAAEAETIFRRLGLDPDFWTIPTSFR